MVDKILRIPTSQELRKVVGGRDGRFPFLEMLTLDLTKVCDFEFVDAGDDAAFTDTATGTGATALAELATQVANGAARLENADHYH